MLYLGMMEGIDVAVASWAIGGRVAHLLIVDGGTVSFTGGRVSWLPGRGETRGRRDVRGTIVWPVNLTLTPEPGADPTGLTLLRWCV